MTVIKDYYHKSLSSTRLILPQKSSLLLFLEYSPWQLGQGIIIFILQMRNLRLRRLKVCSGHTINQDSRARTHKKTPFISGHSIKGRRRRKCSPMKNRFSSVKEKKGKAQNFAKFVYVFALCFDSNSNTGILFCK